MVVNVVAGTPRCVLGEGPLWSARRNALFWVDILGHAVHCLPWNQQRVISWPMPATVGWIIERNNGDGFVIGLGQAFAFFWPETSRIEEIGRPEPERLHNRLNDAKADLCGCIWAGSKDDCDTEASGALYRLKPDRSWTREDDGYLVSNGPTFSLDGRARCITPTAEREWCTSSPRRTKGG